MKKGFTPKTQLTPEEKLRAAFLYECMGVDQHILAAAFGVNPGRIAEAVMDVLRATGAREDETQEAL